MLRPFSDLPDEITADEDFWPRIFRDVRGAIRIRARDVVEAHSVWAIAAHEARVGRILREWKEQIVPAGERHTLVMVWKDDAVLRVVAKIVFGALRLAAPNVPTIESYDRLRRFAIDGEPRDPVASIAQVTDPGGEPAIADHQYVVIVRQETGPVCIVGLYGAHFVVPLAELPADLHTPWAATVRIDGTCGTIIEDANEAMSLAAAVDRLAFGTGSQEGNTSSA